MESGIIDSERLLDVVTIFSLVALAWVLSSVRREWIRVEYSVSWLLAAVVLLVLARWRALDEWLAGVLGVGDAALAVLAITGGVFLIVLYRLSMIISGLKDSNIKLAQRVALLEFRLESIHEGGHEENQAAAAE